MTDEPSPGFDALCAAALEGRRVGEPARAAALLEQAIAGLGRNGDPRRLVTAYRGLGHIQADQGLHVQAHASFLAAVGQARATGDPCLLAHALRHAGRSAAQVGRFTEAIRACNEAVALYGTQPDAEPMDVANALRALARVLEQAGLGDDALAAWRAALPLYQRAGIDDGVAECRARLG